MQLDILVEENSMKVFLEKFLESRFSKVVTIKVRDFGDKASLLRDLPFYLGKYAERICMGENLWVMVLVDRDDDDCIQLKQMLESHCQTRGLVSRSQDANAYRVVNRIVVEELEAWYFGDWQAVKSAYPKVPANVPNQKGFRDSDSIKGGIWEALHRILAKADHVPKEYLPKGKDAEAIAGQMVPARNTSKSFQHFFSALAELCEQPQTRTRPHTSR